MGFIYTLIGVGFGFGAEFWVGMGNIQVKYSHKLDAESDNPKPVYKRGRWWFGFSLYFGNTVFNLISYMFASLNVLAPTAALTIVINAILARIYFKEKLTAKGIIGSLAIMLGCILAIIFGSHSQGDMTIADLGTKANQLSFILYFSIDTLLILIFGIISFRMHSHSIAKDSSNNNNSNNNNNITKKSNKKKEDDKTVSINDITLQTDPNTTVHNANNSDHTAPLPTTMDSYDIGSNFEREKFRHGLRAVLMCFSTAGVTAWVQVLGKICADLLFDTFDGNNQFNNIVSWLVFVATLCLIALELYMISETMRIFDAVLAIPLFNSFAIVSGILSSASYFNDFDKFTALQAGLFTLALIVIIAGIVLVTIGQNSESMKHHETDQMKYISNAAYSKKERLRNMSMATLADEDEFSVRVDFENDSNSSSTFTGGDSGGGNNSNSGNIGSKIKSSIMKTVTSRSENTSNKSLQVQMQLMSLDEEIANEANISFDKKKRKKKRGNDDYMQLDEPHGGL